MTHFSRGVTATGALTNEWWMLGPGFQSTGPRVAEGGVVNAFSATGGVIAPGQIVSLYGAGLGPLGDGVSFGFVSVTGRLPVSGPGVSVTFNGIPAPLYFARADQLNVQAPYELQGAANAATVVTVNGVAGAPVSVPVVAAKPGLFARLFHPDGCAVTAENPATPAAGGEFPEPIAETSLRIGGQEAVILFRGQAPGTAGVMQINARIPDGLSGSAAAVTLTIGGAESQPGVTLPLRTSP